MVSFRPLSRFIPLINGLFMAYKWGLLTTYKSWDDPPSTVRTPEKLMGLSVEAVKLPKPPGGQCGVRTRSDVRGRMV